MENSEAGWRAGMRRSGEGNLRLYGEKDSETSREAEEGK